MYGDCRSQGMSPPWPIHCLENILLSVSQTAMSLGMQNMSSEAEHHPAAIKHLVSNVPIVEKCTTQEDPNKHYL